MPRSPSEYSRREWMRLRPLVDSYKHHRHQVFVTRLVRRPARGGDPPDAIHRIRATNALLTVAFNAPQKIDVQATLVKAFVPNAVYVVFDNSDDDRRAADVQRVARARCRLRSAAPGTVERWRERTRACLGDELGLAERHTARSTECIRFYLSRRLSGQTCRPVCASAGLSCRRANLVSATEVASVGRLLILSF